MTTPLRGALIGCGFFGRIQLEAWGRIEGVTIAAACDPVIERAQAVATHAYSDPTELLDQEQIDFIDIATRPDTHAELIRLAADRGIPVICQKPLATSMTEAVELVSAVASRGVPVMVHENWCWQPWFRQAKAMIKAGVIGEPLTYNFKVRQNDGRGEGAYPNQPYFRQMPRLLIYETLIHFIDTARFLFGDIHSVHAHVRRLNPLIVGEDRAILTIEHVTTLDGVIDGHRFLNPEPPGPMMGTAEVEGMDGVLRILATGDILVNNVLGYSPPPSIGYKGDSVRAVQLHFIEHLRGNAALESSLENYMPSFAAAEAAYLSAQEGRTVLVNYRTGAI